MTDRPVLVTRTLSRTKAATRRRLIDAAISLATEGGYDAVGMREVAAEAGLSYATAYQYYSSKDELLVDVLVERNREATEALDQRPPTAGTPAERVIKVLRNAVRGMERNPLLYSAIIRAYISNVTLAEMPLSELLPRRSWIEIAIGDDIENHDVVLHIIQDAYLAAMVQFTTGRRPADLITRLEEIVHLILPSDDGAATNDGPSADG